MRWRTCPTQLGRLALAAGFLALFTGPGSAADVAYCVTCGSPHQTYVCRVTGQSSRPSDALKLYCIVRTAKEGKHASCAAQRADSSCAGIEKVYSYDGPAMAPDIAAEPKVHKLQERIAREQQAFEKPKGSAPKSLVELGGRAYSASRDRWRRIGGANEAEAPQTTLPPETQSTAAPRQSESLSLQAAPWMEAPAPPPAQATTASSEPSASRAQRMGSAVGGFTRKSWRCMRSLFRNCSEPEPDALQ